MPGQYQAPTSAVLVKDHDPEIPAILRYFEYSHLALYLQQVAAPFREVAYMLVAELQGPELKAGLRKLLEAKDCMVRARLDWTESTAPYEGRHEERGGILCEPDPTSVPYRPGIDIPDVPG